MWLIFRKEKEKKAKEKENMADSHASCQAPTPPNEIGEARGSHSSGLVSFLSGPVIFPSGAGRCSWMMWGLVAGLFIFIFWHACPSRLMA